MAGGNEKLTRRELGKKAAIASSTMAAVAMQGRLGAAASLPRRSLGKTGVEVSVLGIGCSPLGREQATQEGANRVIDAALDEGINYLDTAPIYGLSEIRLGHALKGKRDKFVLVSKVEATSRQDANWQMTESLRKLQTDYLDVVHLHNVGRTDRFPSMDVLTGEDGALQALRDAKKKGMIRHIGLTCHLRPRRVMPILATGDIELVMCAANFVDVHTYNFEGTAFAEAKKRGLGIVAMKIIGGAEGEGAKLSAAEHYQDGVRYALSIPGLSVAIMGMKNVAELKKAVATVKAYKPFSEQELSKVTEKGKLMAKDWGELRGPLV